MAIFGPIILLAMLGSVAIVTLTLERWILQPLISAARDSKLKTQFFLSDMYVLMLQLAFPGLLLASQIGREDERMLAVVIALSVLLILVWLTGVSMLSRASVTRAWPRAVSLCIAIPGAYVGSFTVSGVALFAFLNRPFLLPILGIGALLLMAICNALARWAIKSKLTVHSER